MGQATQTIALEPVRALRRGVPLRTTRTQSPTDQSAELRRLRAELVQAQKELRELKGVAAQWVRHLI
jgi:hypothetical protein